MSGIKLPSGPFVVVATLVGKGAVAAGMTDGFDTVGKFGGLQRFACVEEFLIALMGGVVPELVKCGENLKGNYFNCVKRGTSL